MKNCLLLFATCLALFSCSSDTKKQEKISQTISKIDTIEVNYPWTPKSKEEDVIMCYFDEFGQYSLQFGINKIPNNIFLKNNYVYAVALLPVINFNQNLSNVILHQTSLLIPRCSLLSPHPLHQGIRNDFMSHQVRMIIIQS